MKNKKIIKNKKKVVPKLNADKVNSLYPEKQTAWAAFNKWSIWLIILLTALVFHNTLNNGFVDWDDYEYIVDNPFIKAISIANILQIFSEPYFSNYHPLTTLSYALDFKLFGLNPQGYHLVNLILHIINTLLVFALFKHIAGKNVIPFISALLFALHPMHVESVAWISERKDVLFTAFFLSSLIYWLKFIKSESLKLRLYFASLLLFVCALLSKSAAVTLPLIALLISYFLYKKINYKEILKLSPFFVLSVLFGIITLLTQNEAVSDISLSFSFIERLLLIFYALFFYLLKFIVPLNFSALHLYPETVNGFLPAVYYFAPLIIIVLIACIIKSKKEFKHALIFGLLFFLFNIFTVIQIIPVGSAVVAERYTYVPYIGLSFIIAHSYVYLSQRFNKHLLLFVLSAFTLFIALSAHLQIKVWKNDVSLWSQALKSNNENVIAYNKRGVAYAKNGDYLKALADYNNAVSIKPAFKDSYYNRANSKRELADFRGAVNDYSKALQLKPDYFNAYNNRGLALTELGDINAAIADFNKAIELKPEFAQAYNNRGLAKVKAQDYAGAVQDYNIAANIKPDYSDVYHNRGLPKYKLGDIQGAIEDCNTALKLKPDFAETYINRAFLKFESGDHKGACNDWLKAEQLGHANAPVYLKQYCR